MTPSTTFRYGDDVGLRTLVLLQGTVAVLLGALLFASPWTVLGPVVLMLGVYWLLQGLGALVHALVEPRLWAVNGVVAVLGVVAGLLVIQAPLAGFFEISMAVVLFLGVQAVIGGGCEVYVGLRENTPALAVVGWVSVALGGLLLTLPFLGIAGLVPAMGLVALGGGGLAVYLAARVPRAQRAVGGID